MKTLFVLGDSISMQYGPYLGRMLAGRFAVSRKGAADLPGRTEPWATNANGCDSSWVRAYLDARLAAPPPFAPDVLLLNCGLHDIKADPRTGALQVPLAGYEANLRAVVERIGRTPIRGAWARTTPVVDEIHNARCREFRRRAADVAAYNAVADRLFGEAGWPVADLHGFTNALGEGVFCDHVHFTDRVRELQAAYLAGFLAGGNGRLAAIGA